MSGHQDIGNEPTKQWGIAPSRLDLDPARYLGERAFLLSPAGQEPGDWCDVVIGDGEGEIRWTLVVQTVRATGHPRGALPLDDALGSGQ